VVTFPHANTIKIKDKKVRKKRRESRSRWKTFLRLMIDVLKVNSFAVL